jgi:hypothetical protein
MRRTVLLPAISFALALPALLLLAPAGGAGTTTSKAVWSTVNICDTEAYPDSVGVRGSMPGNGSRQTMHMRFRVQYLRDDGTWALTDGGLTGWKSVGSARFVRREHGYTFKFDPLPEGETRTLRGVINFQLRARKKRGGRVRSVVVRRARAVSEARTEPVREADPPGYSAAHCELQGPAPVVPPPPV